MSKVKRFLGLVIIIAIMAITGLISYKLVREFASSKFTSIPKPETATSPSTPPPPINDISPTENRYDVALQPFTLGNLNTGEILPMDLPISGFDWSNDGKWIAAYDFQSIWIISPLDGSYYQIEIDGAAYIPTWSPYNNKITYLVRPSASADWTNIKLNIYDVDKKLETTIANFNNCTGNTPGVFFSKQWLLIDVYLSTDCVVNGESLNDRTIAINLETAKINIFPNLDVRRVRFSSTDSRLIIETSKQEYYVADFNSPNYLVLATSDKTFSYGDFDWLPEGNLFYRIAGGKVSLINTRTGDVETSWSSNDLGWYSFVSPDGSLVISDTGKLFELGSGTTQNWWGDGIENICAVNWMYNHEIVNILTCKPFSEDISALEITLIKNNGDKIRLGDNATLFSQFKVKVNPQWGVDYSDK